MEQLLSSLVFNGSIVEAITEAKQQKKLFVVFVSGGNMESNQLETSAWLDPRVADSISKYCILLHILEGSIDARNLSALYPQKAVPCITAIGYNGVQLWQHGGFVSADNLASSLEKAWLSLHVQDTTVTFLTAALASKKELVSGASSVASEVGSSSSAQVSPAQAMSHIQSPMATPSKNSQIVEGEDRGHAAMEIDSSVIDMASHGAADAFESRIGEFNESTTVITTAEKPLDLVEVYSTKAKDECSMSKENPGLCDQQLDPNDEAPREIANKAGKGPEINLVEDAAAEKADFSDDLSNTFHDVYLNIRLPDGSSLQVKFLVIDTLRMVKHYVDKNQESSIGYYDLAVPYPRKVFGDEDLDRTLSDLGLHNRQALIIVLRNKMNVTSLHGQNNPAESNHKAIGGDAGYFATIRKLFPYVNPLSYFGGTSNTSNTAQDSRDSIWQYGPNSTPQNNQNLMCKPFQAPITSSSNNRGRKPASSSFGSSNIHTLKHDEDENQFGDRNTFWNGNDHSEHLDDQEGNIDTRNSPSAFPFSRDDGISYEGENNVYEESDDSDDDYSSIQKPAFRVTGEPNFDSGPPEDGLEYLRRVRWEALWLPKVKVAAVPGCKLNKGQTSYMPQIPDIASCLEHLLPLKEWEEAFLADFSELRQALSHLEANVGASSQLHSGTFVDQPHSSDQLPESNVLDKFDGLMSGEDEFSLSDAGDDPALENSIQKSSPSNSPTLSVILRMDSVARVSILRKRITAVQSMSSLTRDDCLWLFALCAAVDTPVDADTCAALRSLLRKCANLRADKSYLDDEVIMLNMLVTISGRYFGQSEQ